MLFRPQDRKLLDRQQEGGFMRFVTEDEMEARDDKLRAEWRGELRNALEAMRPDLDCVEDALATLPQQPEPPPVAYCKCDEADGDNAECRIHYPKTPRIDLAAPVRAGTTLWVGQGPDPREQKPADVNPRPVGWLCEWEKGNFRGPVSFYPVEQVGAKHATGFLRQYPVYAAPRSLTLADIPAELRAEIEAAERERCALHMDAVSLPVSAGRVRALGPREVKP